MRRTEVGKALVTGLRIIGRDCKEKEGGERRGKEGTRPPLDVMEWEHVAE